VKARKRPGGKRQEYDPGDPPDIPGVVNLTLIGGGGNASVYRGTETAMRRPVAVKVLHTRMRVRDGEQRQVFSNECENAGQVGRHAYAADIYRQGFADDWPFIVMPYYTRGSLAARLKSSGPLPVGEALAICAGVATALQFAHTLGILHRDVKPENILGDSFGPPVLADFGISTARDAATRTVHHAMTPAYAPPEVVQHGGGWPTSDVWSLAATLYTLLAGRPPFYDPRLPDPRANLRAVSGPLPPIGRDDVPPQVEQVLSRALIGQPDARTTSARIFAEQLNDCLPHLGLPPVPVSQEDPGPVGLPNAGQYGNGRHVGAGYAGGQQTGYLSAGNFRVHGTSAGPSAGDFHVSRAEVSGGTGARPLSSSLPTGLLNSEDAFRGQADQPAEPPRRRVPRAVLAGGGAVILVGGALGVYALVGSPASSRGGDAREAASGNASSAAATGSAAGAGSRSSPSATGVTAPSDVIATLVTSTSVRLTWTNTRPASQVVVSLGTGEPVRVYANSSAVTVTGLARGHPYCFAVGYYLGLQGSATRVAWSTLTDAACVNGAIPSD
jgi:serine/threonine protein kinase